MADRWAKRAHSRGYNGDRRERDRDDPLMQFMLARLQPDDHFGHWRRHRALGDPYGEDLQQGDRS